MSIKFVRKKKTTEDVSPLVRYGGNLVKIRKVDTWRNQELIVTPSDERFACAAVSATYGAGELAKWNELVNVNDGRTITGGMRTAFASMTEESWNDGHKPSFMYWSRGWGTSGSNFIEYSTCDPWYAKTATGTTSFEEFRNTMGCGGSWSALYFNLYALPVAMASSSTLSLRFYNPSWMVNDWYLAIGYKPTDVAALAERVVTSPDSSYLNNAPATMQYNVFAELQAPPAVDAQDYESAKVDFASSSVSNQGKINWEWRMTDVSYHGWYDPWDVSSQNNGLLGPASRATPYYHPLNSQDDYYADVVLDASVKSRIFAIQDAGYGGFWLIVGPTIRNYFDLSTLRPGTCAMMFFSRVELVLKLTFSGFNYI